MTDESDEVSQIPDSTPAQEAAQDNLDDNLAEWLGQPDAQTEAEAVEVVEEAAEEEAQTPAVEQPAVDPELVELLPKLERYKNADGSYDVGKLGKTLVEQEKMIGRTSRDREELNKLQQAAQEADTYRQLIQYDPDMAEAYDRAVKRRQGQFVAPKAQPQEQVDVHAEAEKLFAQGKRVEATRLLAAAEADRRMAEARAQADMAKAHENARREWGEFIKKHTADGLFEASGEVKDHELYSEMQSLYKSGKNVNYDEAWLLANVRLSRPILAKPRVDPGKAGAMAAGGLKGKPPAKRAPQNASKREILPGLTEEEFSKSIDR